MQHCLLLFGINILLGLIKNNQLGKRSMQPQTQKLNCGLTRVTLQTGGMISSLLIICLYLLKWRSSGSVLWEQKLKLRYCLLCMLSSRLKYIQEVSFLDDLEKPPSFFEEWKLRNNVVAAGITCFLFFIIMC
jgi:hypothetical protein